MPRLNVQEANARRTVVLGSQSAQRYALLQQLLPASRIRVCPPLKSEEAGFEGLTDRDLIEQRLQLIVDAKNEDVFNQLADDDWAVVMTADTVIVVNQSGRSIVLGKPEGPNWKETVRDWFESYYSARSHEVLTAVRFRFPNRQTLRVQSTTTVCFRKIDAKLLEWYLETQDSLGKAGGYGIQTTGNLFVESLQGSLSNVIGLPLEEVWSVLNSHHLLDQ